MTTNDEIGDATIKVHDDDGDAGDDAGDAGDGSGDGMLPIHPLTRSHCHTATRTLGHSLGHSFIHSFIHSFVHSLLSGDMVDASGVISVVDAVYYRPPCHTLTCSKLKAVHAD